jgi:hypothetical protein
MQFSIFVPCFYAFAQTGYQIGSKINVWFVFLSAGGTINVFI